jgi:hypothetical protein
MIVRIKEVLKNMTIRKKKIGVITFSPYELPKNKRCPYELPT